MLEDLAERDPPSLAEVLLGKSPLELRWSDGSSFDEVDTDPRIAIGSMTQQLEEVREVQRTEWLDDESRCSDRAGEGSSIRFVTCREQDDADVSRILGRFELAADRVTIATVTFECDIQEKDLGTVAPHTREAFVRRRRLDHPISVPPEQAGDDDAHGVIVFLRSA